MSRGGFFAGERMTVVVAGYLLALAFGYVVLVLPLQANRAELADQVAAARQQLAGLEARIENVGTVAPSEPAEWNRARERLIGRLAHERELPLLIEALVREGDAAGVIVAITGEPRGVPPGDVETRPDRSLVLEELPGVISVRLHCRLVGPYSGVGAFVEGLGRLGWLLEIGDLDLEAADAGVEADLYLEVWLRSRDVG